MKKSLLIVATFVLTTSTVFSQVPDTLSIKSVIQSNLATIKNIIFKTPDIEALIKEDEENSKDTIPNPYRYGVPVNEHYNYMTSATPLAIGQENIQVLKITAYAAKTIDIVFNKYNLPKETKLFILNSSLNIAEMYSDGNNQPHGRLVISLIEDEEIYLALYKPGNISETVQLEIEGIIFGYKEPFESVESISGNSRAIGDAKECNVKVYCSGWLPESYRQNATRAVFRYTVGGFSSTGALVNQPVTELNIQPLFLTARHSISVSNINPSSPTYNLEDMNFFFNYSSSDCTYDLPTGFFSRYRLNSLGATLIRRDYDADMALLRMNGTPPPHFNVYYAGWSAQGNQTNTNLLFYGIHHPKSDIKMASTAIGLEVTPPRYTIFWIDGITEQGSSGSPLFNSNERVIGVLSFGLSGCDIPGPDNYGKLSKFWNQHSSVREALGGGNPNVIGVSGNEIHCYENLTLGGTTAVEIDYWPANEYQPENNITLRAEQNIEIAGNGRELIIRSGADYTFEAGQTIRLLPGFSTEAGANAVLRIAPCTAQRSSGIEVEYGEPEDISATTNIKESEEISEQKQVVTFSIYPNPATNELNFEFQVKDSDVLLFEIFNSMGQKVMTVINNEVYASGNYSHKIQLEKLGPGVYYFIFKNKVSITTKSFVVVGQ